jgi:hypothetical protein
MSQPIDQRLQDLDSLLPLEQDALLRLLEAQVSALRCGRDACQFALTLRDIECDGITATMLRVLVIKGLVEHFRETKSSSGHQRKLGPVASLCFSDQSCFLLTPAGVAWAESLRVHRANIALAAPAPRDSAVPCFIQCEGRRELRVGEIHVKVFHAYARNQETVLQAFQDCHWLPWIPSPLQRFSGKNPKLRLHDTIARLNRHQAHPALRFHGDGTGMGLSWESLVMAVNREATGRQQPNR